MRRTLLVKPCNKEVEELATYLAGFAEGRDDDRLRNAADWLEKLSHYVCGQGYIQCNGGPECSSDHK